MELKVRQMLEAIQSDTEFSGRLTGRPTLRREVLEAMAEVPREEFVSPELRPYAYENRALPIQGGQTISQPFIVALMTDLLDPDSDDVVLEIGTGSGYQAAVLSHLVRKIYSVERLEELAAESAERLNRLGIFNVEVRCGDGYEGWPQHAPYDGIIVTAAAAHVPPPLVAQLKTGARMVIPVGRPGFFQELVVVEKGLKGEVTTRDVLGVAFVPLIHAPPRGEQEG